jgi:inosose dehydratase
MRPSRRTFLAGAGAAFAASAFSTSAFSKGAPGIRFGYAAITWGKDGMQAIDDISAVGYEGIQLRTDSVTAFQPAQLREILQQRKLTFVALSSGELPIDPAVERDQLAKHTANAKFVHDSGGLYLQIMDQLKTYPRTVAPEECTRLGKLLTELGKRTADVGVPLVYHNHMNSISEHPANLDIVLRNSDPKYVKLLLDTAHSVAGGGDPALAVEEYHDRLLLLHIKDGVDIPPGTSGAAYPFKFVELGRGRVDLLRVFDALDKVKYQGWAVVELDRVPDSSTTPRNSAVISRRFLEEKVGVRFPTTLRAKTVPGSLFRPWA